MQPVDPKNNNPCHVTELEEQARRRFKNRIIHKNITATNNVMSDTFNIEEATKASRDTLIALNATNGLQSMLVAQMLSIHQLQQKTMCYAHGTMDLESEKYYANSAVKLANCFVQQASLLAKLQGMGGQKIIVEHVDVHQGGQAIVGNIQGIMGNEKKI